jgi:hypothetical protein
LTHTPMRESGHPRMLSSNEKSAAAKGDRAPPRLQRDERDPGSGEEDRGDEPENANRSYACVADVDLARQERRLACGVQGGHQPPGNDEADEMREAVREKISPTMIRMRSPQRVVALPHLPRTVMTGQGADAMTRVATLPMTILDRPVRPWVPITMKSARLAFAARTI